MEWGLHGNLGAHSALSGSPARRSAFACGGWQEGDAGVLRKVRMSEADDHTTTALKRPSGGDSAAR